jgi:hypothetical protein
MILIMTVCMCQTVHSSLAYARAYDNLLLTPSEACSQKRNAKCQNGLVAQYDFESLDTSQTLKPSFTIHTGRSTSTYSAL